MDVCVAYGFETMSHVETWKGNEFIALASDVSFDYPVGGFYSARVTSSDGTISKPLTGMRGTHVAGGSAVWIVGDLEHMTARGFRPLGRVVYLTPALNIADDDLGVLTSAIVQALSAPT